jgi:hypothetical protein
MSEPPDRTRRPEAHDKEPYAPSRRAAIGSRMQASAHLPLFFLAFCLGNERRPNRNDSKWEELRARSNVRIRNSGLIHYENNVTFRGCRNQGGFVDSVMRRRRLGGAANRTIACRNVPFLEFPPGRAGAMMGLGSEIKRPHGNGLSEAPPANDLTHPDLVLIWPEASGDQTSMAAVFHSREADGRTNAAPGGIGTPLPPRSPSLGSSHGRSGESCVASGEDGPGVTPLGTPRAGLWANAAGVSA